MNVISVKNLSYTYPNTKKEVLHNISFDIENGSYTAIVGSNGSGKSTLSRIICGLQGDFSNCIDVMQDKIIGLVFQSPKDQIVSSIIYRDTAFGPQNLKLHKSEVELRTIECLNITEMLEHAKRSTSSISLGQTQKVALSGMLALLPDVLILDESVAMLDPESRSTIFDFLSYWNKRGYTIIHITHDMEAVCEANQIIALEKGNIIFNGSKDDFLKNKEVLQIINGPELTENQKKSDFSSYEPSFEIKNCNFKYDNKKINKTLDNINFSLYKGTITALTGPSGAGKSTILELGAGLLKAQEGGAVLCKTKPVLAFQNSSNAFFEAFAADDVAFGPKNEGLKGKELKKRVEESMMAVNLPFEEFADCHTQSLSGGQQRRLALAGVIALNKDVMFFDEPTAGLDGQSRYEILQLMRKLADEGKTILFSTHKTDEAAFADREINIQNGKIIYDTCKINSSKNLTEPMAEYESLSILNGLRNTSSGLSGERKIKKSLLEKVPGFLKILIFLTLFITSLALRPWWACLLFSVIAFGYCKLCGFSIKKLLLGFLKILPFLILFSIFQLIFQPALPNEIHFTNWRWFTVTPSKLLLCLSGILRTISSMAIICGFFISTPEFELIDGLKILLYPFEIMKIPVRYFILVMEIIFRFIPLLVDEAYTIIKIQIMRGGFGKVKGKFAKIKSMVPLFVPLIIQTIRRSEALADAITMRCFK